MKQTGTFKAVVHAAPGFLFFTGKGGVGKTTLLYHGNGSGGQRMPRVAGSYLLWLF